MEYIYNSYFKHNPYPSLVLRPENGSIYRIYDVNEAFLEIMQVEKDALLDKDIFDSFLNNEKNAASVVTAILKTSLAYVKTYWVPRKIDKLPITHFNRIGGENKKIWEIYSYPVLDEGDNLKYLLLIAREIEGIIEADSIIRESPSNNSFRNRKTVLILKEFNNMLNSSAEMDEAVSKALQIIGENIRVGRLYYYQNKFPSAEGNIVDSPMSEWVKIGEWCSSEHLHAYNLPFEITEEMFLPLSQRIEFCRNMGEIVNVALKKLLTDNGVKTIYVLPVFLNEEFHGFIGTDDCDNERIWSADEKDLMKCVAAQLASSLESNLD
jgi:hypothetical protein